MTSSFWNTWVTNSGAIFDMNLLFREFHQQVSIPHPTNIKKICEGRLAQVVNQSVERIHFHGMDVEMANLTVEQPGFKVLKVEMTHGLKVDRASNGKLEDLNVNKSSILGAPCDYYVPKNDKRDMFDSIELDHKPYLVAVTCLIESPMKLFVYNQNCSKILFGSEDTEHVKNVVRFEANLAWSDLLHVLPTNNKPHFDWRITDWNNIMNENPLF